MNEQNTNLTGTVSSEDKKEQEMVTLKSPPKPQVPEGMWIQCKSCKHIMYKKDLLETKKVCSNCGMHFRLNAWERIEMITDAGTFKEMNRGMATVNPLDFPGYEGKIEKSIQNTGLYEAAVTGFAEIDKQPAYIGVLDSFFMMGSMGSVVGEKLTRLIETATEDRVPLIIFTASGGARMQEGIFSLMQMAKTSAALAKFDDAGLLYITVITDPTTGGVTASFAMLGDIILAEPGALIGFAGARVIEQTIRQKLPEGFQRSEFLLEHGFVDSIIHRKDLRNALSKILYLHR